MTRAGSTRRHGTRQSHPLPIWSGILDHCGRIGSALWEFIWIIDKITDENNGVGIVLGGAPVKIETIARDLGRGDHTIRRNLEQLEKEKYIERIRTPYGFTIKVRNSHKFQIWSRKETVTNGRSTPSNLADLTVTIGRNKEDAAVDATEAAVRAAAAPNLTPWKAIGLHSPVGHKDFRQLWEISFASKNGQRLSMSMGTCADAWQDAGGKVPGSFFAALARIRIQERQNSPSATDTEIVKLEVPA